MAYPIYKGKKAWTISGSGEACVIFSTSGDGDWRGPLNRKITIHDGANKVTFTNRAAYELANIFVEIPLVPSNLTELRGRRTNWRIYSLRCYTTTTGRTVMSIIG
jgi:hypothetical protein